LAGEAARLTVLAGKQTTRENRLKLRNAAMTVAATGLLAAAAAQPASAYESHRYWCSDSLTGAQICNYEAGRLSLQGWHVSAVHHNPQGCTGVGGCYPGYYFDYWR
jgi:hypothetical protein